MLDLSLTCTLENGRLGWDRQVTWLRKTRNIRKISVGETLTKHWLATASYWQLKLVEFVKNISEACQLMRPRNIWKIILASDQLNAQILFLISFLYTSTCFEHCCAHHHEVKLYYTASGIITLCRWTSVAQVSTGLPSTECDDTRCCITQFWPPDDEHNSDRNM